MTEYRLGVVEEQFAKIIWDNEPIMSGDLVKLCADKLDWKKSTTYTVLRKLCQRGIFQNKDGEVTSVIGKEDFYSLQSKAFVDETFKGSLPAFIAAFTARKSLSQKEVEEIHRLIDDYRGE